MGIKSVSNFITLLLALAGCIVAIVLTVEEFSPRVDIGCSRVGGDCSKTINSAYGHLGPIPTSILGLGMYGTIAGLCLLRHTKLRRRRAAEAERVAALSEAGDMTDATDMESHRTLSSTADAAPDQALALGRQIKLTEAALWGIALVGAGISWWLQYTSLFVLSSFCPWCFSSAIIITTIALLASYDFLLEGRRLDGEQKMLAGVSVFILLGAAAIAMPAFWDKISEIRGRPVEGPMAVSVTLRQLILSSDMDVKGDLKSDCTLVEFADYQCPHCQLASRRMEVLMKTPPRPLRFAFRNFPLDHHTWSMSAAAAAEAAGKQGKFWQMHDLIFERQTAMEATSFTQDMFVSWAKELGLNENKFREDMKSGAITQHVTQDHVAGDSAGLKSTPTFYVVTPTQITMLPNLGELERVWKNPKDKVWR